MKQEKADAKGNPADKPGFSFSESWYKLSKIIKSDEEYRRTMDAILRFGLYGEKAEHPELLGEGGQMLYGMIAGNA